MKTAVVKHQGGELFNVSMERFEGAFKLAHTFAASGMFPDAKTAERACVKVMAGMEMGIAPLAAMTGIHVIDTGGRVSVTAGANLMAQCVKEHPDYDYRVNHFTTDRDAPFWEEDFLPGDIIHEMNGTQIASLEDLRSQLTALKPFDPVVFQIERNGRLFYFSFEFTR